MIALHADPSMRSEMITSSSGQPLLFGRDLAPEQREWTERPKAVGFASDGSLFLVDEHRVVRATPDLRIVQTVGRFGQGPGEFAYLNALCITPHDTVVVQDGASRFTVLSPGGAFVRHFRAESGASISSTYACLGDGSLIAVRMASREQDEVVALSTNGHVLKTLASYSSDNDRLYDAQTAISATPTGFLMADPIEGTITIQDFGSSAPRVYASEEPSAYAVEIGRRPSAVGMVGSGKNSTGGSKDGRPRHFLSAAIAPDSLLWLQQMVDPWSGAEEWTGYDMATGAGVVRLQLQPPDSSKTRLGLLAITVHQYVFSVYDEDGLVSVRVVNRRLQ